MLQEIVYHHAESLISDMIMTCIRFMEGHITVPYNMTSLVSLYFPIYNEASFGLTVYYGIDNSFSGLFPHVAQVCQRNALNPTLLLY